VHLPLPAPVVAGGRGGARMSEELPGGGEVARVAARPVVAGFFGDLSHRCPSATNPGGLRKNRDGSPRSSSISRAGYGPRHERSSGPLDEAAFASRFGVTPGWPWPSHRAKMGGGWEARAEHERGLLPRG